MRRLLVLGGSAWLLVMLLTTAVSADKWVRAKVSAVGADSVTVMFKGMEMKFAVTADTDVEGPGLGTAQRRQGGPLKLTDAVKVGDGVEIHYVESAGTMRATDIRTGLSTSDASSTPDAVSTSGAASDADSDSGDSASGRITAVTATSLTIKSDNSDMTFAVDARTRVMAQGAGTATRAALATGAGPTLADLVKVGEDVVVTFRKSGATSIASEVRVRSLRPPR